MVVLDTSAVIEFLRGTGSAVHRTVVRLGRDPRVQLAITEVVLMEVLAGARGEAQASRLADQLTGFTMLRLDPFQGYEDAAAMSEDTVRRYASAALGLTVHT